MTGRGMAFRVFLCVLLVLPLVMAPAYAAVPDDDNNKGLISGIVGGIVDGLMSGIKFLFVPDEAFMEDFRDSISSRFEAKFSGVTGAIDYLKKRFSGLRRYRDLEGIFKVTWPKDTFMYGLSVNLLTAPAPVLDFVRLCSTGLCVVTTAILCYRKIISIVKT